MLRKTSRNASDFSDPSSSEMDCRTWKVCCGLMDTHFTLFWEIIPLYSPRQHFQCPKCPNFLELGLYEKICLYDVTSALAADKQRWALLFSCLNSYSSSTKPQLSTTLLCSTRYNYSWFGQTVSSLCVYWLILGNKTQNKSQFHLNMFSIWDKESESYNLKCLILWPYNLQCTVAKTRLVATQLASTAWDFRRQKNKQMLARVNKT